MFIPKVCLDKPIRRRIRRSCVRIVLFSVWGGPLFGRDGQTILEQNIRGVDGLGQTLEVKLFAISTVPRGWLPATTTGGEAADVSADAASQRKAEKRTVQIGFEEAVELPSPSNFFAKKSRLHEPSGRGRNSPKPKVLTDSSGRKIIIKPMEQSSPGPGHYTLKPVIGPGWARVSAIGDCPPR